jgi:hypothetical protein
LREVEVERRQREFAMRMEIQPHVGIGPIRFGMTRTEVAAAMRAIGGGEPFAKSAECDRYCDLSLLVEYTDDTVSFIEADSLQHDFLLSGIDVFDTPAEELVAELEKLDTNDAALGGKGSYCFPNLIVALWEADTQYDRKGHETRPIFGAVGIGDSRYLSAIRAIR